MRHYSAGLMTALLLQQVAAHGTVNSVSVGGTKYEGYEPSNPPGSPPNPAKGVVWASNDWDIGFVLPTDYANANIICHINSSPAPKAATVAAGDKISLSWPNWPATDPHPGVFLNYLAPAGATEPSQIKKNDLKFVKISQAGYDASVSANGDDKGLATGAFKKAGRVAEVQIPASIKPGLYVLRHEIIALHEAETINKAQNYPQCVTIQVTGSGTVVPDGGVPATSFYKATDPGILVKNFYDKWDPKAYVMPGPAVWSGAGSGTATVASPSYGAAAAPAVVSAGAASASGSASSSVPKNAGGSSSGSSSGGSSSGGASGGYSQKGGSGTAPASSGSGSGTSSGTPSTVSIVPGSVAAAPAISSVPSVVASPASGAAPAADAQGDDDDDEEECKKNKSHHRNRKAKSKSASYERRHARDLMIS